MGNNQQAVENVAKELSSKGVDFFQNLADQFDIGVDVQAQFDQASNAAQQYFDANKSAWENEFNSWMSANGYDQQLNEFSAEATKIKTRTKPQIKFWML